MDQMETLLLKLRNLLGLSSDADPAAIVAAVEDLLTARNSSSPDPATYVPIGVLEAAISEVNRLNAGVSAQLAEAHVETQIRNGNMPPMMRDWGIALCRVNKPAFDAFVNRTGRFFNAIVDPKRYPGQAPAPARQLGSLTHEERVVCLRMGMTEDEFLKARAFTDHARD